ncbi:MAG: peptidoglycan bridge formation glycyltransferase FemA/FemB family protein [Chthonomonadaceae bacterium]|nr:peptidoglycan bridge formation glycyltransferase FemA/FemB family protein [Chthonomonadaceae bacterium]
MQILRPIPDPITSALEAEWDALLSEKAETGFMQSVEWAAFKQSEGYEVLRLGLFEGEILTGGGTLLWFPSERKPGFVLCPEGPALDWENREASRDALRLFIEAAQNWRAEAIGLRIEPHLPLPRPSVLRNWKRAPIDLTPVQSLHLDLSLGEDELKARMHPKCRYNLGLAERHGVTVRESRDKGDLHTFYRLFAETARRQQFFGEPFGFFLNLAETMFPSGMASLLFAEREGEILSAMLSVRYGRRATYLYGASRPETRNFMPNYALHAHAIRLAREAGCREYDFYGYDPYGQKDHAYAGFSRFKRGWGGNRVDSIGAWEILFYDRLADRLVEALAEKTS